MVFPAIDTQSALNVSGVTPEQEWGLPDFETDLNVISEVMRILVVEDERKTASFIRKALQAEGFAVDVLHDGDEVLPAVSSGVFDLLILDIMLPGRDGLSILRELRERRCVVPVLLLTARGTVGERVDGLNLGADDYLAKPFALAELAARVRALTRRNRDVSLTVLRVGDLWMDTVRRRVERAGKVVELTAREYRLLEFLMRSPGQVCARMAIVEGVWDYDFDPGTNLVDVYVMRLREKTDSGQTVRLIHTVRGVGYMINEGPP